MDMTRKFIQHRSNRIYTASKQSKIFSFFKTQTKPSDTYLTIRLDSMFQAIQLPAGITDLNTGLTNMDWQTFTLYEKKREKKCANNQIRETNTKLVWKMHEILIWTEKMPSLSHLDGGEASKHKKIYWMADTFQVGWVMSFPKWINITIKGSSTNEIFRWYLNSNNLHTALYMQPLCRETTTTKTPKPQ